jgi:hypothetical protein
MKTLFLSVILGLTIQLSSAQTNFNVFKAYDKAKVRPMQYSKKHTKHAISEYLAPSQKRMMAYRKGPDTPAVMWNDKTWSGFKKTLNQSRRLDGIDSAPSSILPISLHHSAFIFILGALAAVISIISAGGYFILRARGMKGRNEDQLTKWVPNDLEIGAKDGEYTTGELRSTSQSA